MQSLYKNLSNYPDCENLTFVDFVAIIFLVCTQTQKRRLKENPFNQGCLAQLGSVLMRA
jgi:hypothetical protein